MAIKWYVARVSVSRRALPGVFAVKARCKAHAERIAKQAAATSFDVKTADCTVACKRLKGDVMTDPRAMVIYQPSAREGLFA